MILWVVPSLRRQLQVGVLRDEFEDRLRRRVVFVGDAADDADVVSVFDLQQRCFDLVLF